MELAADVVARLVRASSIPPGGLRGVGKSKGHRPGNLLALAPVCWFPLFRPRIQWTEEFYRTADPVAVQLWDRVAPLYGNTESCVQWNEGESGDREKPIVDERRLIEELLRRSPGAWNELVTRYQRLVYAQVMRAMPSRRSDRDSGLVEDIVAEVFMGLLKNEMSTLRSFRGQCKISTWLSVIARRVCWRYVARLPRESAIGSLSDSNVQIELGVSIEDNSLNELIGGENQDLLREQLNRLKPADRQVLELFYLQQLDYRTISEQMGISINAVGPKLSRAHARLKQLMRVS